MRSTPIRLTRSPFNQNEPSLTSILRIPNTVVSSWDVLSPLRTADREYKLGSSKCQSLGSAILDPGKECVTDSPDGTLTGAVCLRTMEPVLSSKARTATSPL